MFHCCKFTYLSCIGLAGIGLASVVALNPMRQQASAQDKPQEKKVEAKAAIVAIPLKLAVKATPDEDSKNEKAPENKNAKKTDKNSVTKHPAEELGAADASSTTIEFNNTSLEQLSLFQLTGQGQRQAYGDLAPGLNAEFPTTTGAKFLVTDAKKNAVAVFIADGQPRTIEINDGQLKTWKQQLAQEQIIVRGDHGETLQTFCMGPDDHVYALLAAPQVYGETPTVKSSDPTTTGEVRVYSPQGELVRKFPLEFKPHRIAVAPDGEVIVGGFGVIARYKPDGSLIAKHNPPNMNGTEEDWKKAAKEAQDTNVAQYKEQIENLESQLKAQKETKEKGEGTENKQLEANAEMYAQIIKSYKQQLDSLGKQSIEDAVKDLKQSLGQIYAVTASEDSLYVATRMTTGYGFAVWKMKRDATEGKQIVENLSGCCGQLDIQAKGADLFVAENSRHRVLKFDAEGKKITQFGSRERGGAGNGFGGCCNPMNLCFTTDGNIFTAESEGKVKCFNEEGKFVSALASVRVSGGCKNVAIGATKNRDRIFFLDLTGSKIVISKLAEGADSSSGG